MAARYRPDRAVSRQAEAEDTHPGVKPMRAGSRGDLALTDSSAEDGGEPLAMSDEDAAACRSVGHDSDLRRPPPKRFAGCHRHRRSSPEGSALARVPSGRTAASDPG